MTCRQQQANRIVLLSLVVSALTGCASGHDLIRNGTLNVERMSSDRVKISSLYVRQDTDGVVVRGRFSKRYAGRSPIPGHLHIAFVDPEGGVLSDTRIRYWQLSAKSGLSEFYVQILSEPPIGSTIRVTHHSKNHPYPG